MAVRINRGDLESRFEWKLERTLGTGSHDSPIVDRAAALAFSNDGKQLAVGGGEPSRSGTVHVFTVPTENTKNLLEVHSDTVMGLQFNADGTQIASGGADKFAKISNLADGKILHSFEGHTHHVLGVAGNTTDASSPVSALTMRSRCGT